VYAARARIAGVIAPTPLMRHALLAEETGLDVRVKHENHNPTGAFKVRGGANLIASLSPEERRGVITATTGNHGQSIALACGREHVPCTIVVPLGNNPEKNAAMRALGADLIEHGDDFQASREHAEALARERGLSMVPSFDMALVQGVASYSLELLQAVPDLDVVYVPIGLGSGICGMIAAREALGLKTEIVGVVSTLAPAYALSFEEHRLIEYPVTTRIADGVACRTPEIGALELIWRHVARVVQINDRELEAAMRLMYTSTHNVAEGAGAIGLAAALKERDRLAGRKVATILSGCNVDRDAFARVLAAD